MGNDLNTFLLIAAGIAIAVECEDKEDGVYEWGCDSFTSCIGGEIVITDCVKFGLVYNPDKEECDE